MTDIGHIVDGKYKILRLVSSGGMSNVYLAKDIHLAKKWAVKQIPKTIDGKENSTAIKTAVNEAKIIKSLNHPAIVRIVDIVDEGDSLFIIEDYCEGLSLAAYVLKEKHIEFRMLISWVMEICSILGYLHSREPPIIYRDVKPENFILMKDGHLRLVDFGIARRYKAGKKRDTVYLGTKQYAAPEQFEINERQTDERTDIYSLGKTIQYLTKFTDTKSKKIKKIVEKCTCIDPDKRFQNVKDLKEALLPFQDERGRKKNKNGISLASILLSVIAVVVLAFGATVKLSQKNNKENEISEAFAFIDEAKMDNNFSLDEEEGLLSLLSKIDPYANQEDYEKLVYEIGKIYWFYYAYSVDTNMGKIKSITWFQQISSQNEMAQNYKLIGEFYRDINTCMYEYEDEGMYEELFRSLKRMITKMPEIDQNAMKIEIIENAVSALEMYLRKMKSDGISYEEISELMTLIGEEKTNLAASSPEEDEVIETTNKKYESVEKMIETVFQ